LLFVIVSQHLFQKPAMSHNYRELQSTEEGFKTGAERGSTATKRSLWCCCCGLPALLVGGYFAAVHVVSGMSVTNFLDINEFYAEQYCNGSLTMRNLTDNTWWPGCGPDGEYLPVSHGNFSECKGGCIKTQTMQELHTFDEQFGGRLVSYSSRECQGSDTCATTVMLTGWFLPAPNHTASTPRVVLQHGFTSNSNMYRTQFMAYLLRKIGFSVLVNNFRDHCYSADSQERVNTWGHAAPYDTLGAWDYAVNDPDNVFGGQINDRFVGVMGFSKGAFTAASLFGLEGRVPAVWVDSPPFTPKSGFAMGFQSQLAGMGVGFLAPIFVDPVYANIVAAGRAKGVDITENTPADTLPNGPDTSRPIFWVGNRDDVTVSYSDGIQLLGLLRTYPLKYQVTDWHLEGNCNGETHCEDHIRIPDEYEARMCNFWTGVFGLEESSCGIPGETGRRLQTGRIHSNSEWNFV